MEISQEFPSLLWNTHEHYLGRKSTQLFLIQGHVNPVYNINLYYYKVQFIIISQLSLHTLCGLFLSCFLNIKFFLFYVW